MSARIVCRSGSAEQTREIAGVFAHALQPGDVVVLTGDLGAGKTCFVQGAARARGVGARVTSPSFVLVREYRGDLRIVHADVYRLNTIQELIDIGDEELFDDSSVVFIEWGDAVEGELPDERLTVALRVDGEDARVITFEASSPRWSARLEGLAASLGPWAEAG